MVFFRTHDLHGNLDSVCLFGNTLAITLGGFDILNLKLAVTCSVVAFLATILTGLSPTCGKGRVEKVYCIGKVSL